ncbi:MAG: hypothetical protein AAF570_14065 [Bacteroidota bacterium]
MTFSVFVMTLLPMSVRTAEQAQAGYWEMEPGERAAIEMPQPGPACPEGIPLENY